MITACKAVEFNIEIKLINLAFQNNIWTKSNSFKYQV